MTLKPLAVLAAIVLMGCGARDKPEHSPPPSPATPQLPVRPAPSPTITAIRLHRSTCYGTCPGYEVELSADGRVKYVGDRFVEKTGFYTSSIDPSKFSALADEIKALDFFRLKERYRFESDGCTGFETDNPTSTFIVTAGDHEKIVSYYYGCIEVDIGPKLEALAESIDRIAGSSQWVGHSANAL